MTSGLEDNMIEESLPAMNLHIQHAKLQGINVSTFDKLKHHAQQMAPQSRHLKLPQDTPQR
jgi:hypothetical protein